MADLNAKFRCTHCNNNTDVLCSYTQFSPFYDGGDYCKACFKGLQEMNKDPEILKEEKPSENMVL